MIKESNGREFTLKMTYTGNDLGEWEKLIKEFPC
jgi:hypothetical protein